MVRFDWWEIASRPFDLDALVAQDRRPRRPSRETIERYKRARRRNRKKKQRAIIEAKLAARRRPGQRYGWIRYALFRVMVPGQWYAVPDLARLSGIASHPVAGQLYGQRFGTYLKAPNPDWRPEMRNKAPRYLWSLSPSGEAEQAAWRAAGEPARYDHIAARCERKRRLKGAGE